MLPQTQLVNVKASTITATASVPFLGHTTNPIKIGTKEQSEKWVQTVLKVENKKTYVFCLDLGKTCRTGDTFSYNYTTGTDAWETYSSESSNEARALYAKIGHWYYNNGNYTKKRWIYAQALIWAVSEGETSKTELTNVIKALNDDPVTYENTSYKSTKTAANLYSEIFDKENVSIRVRTWVNENNNRQKLFEVYDEFIGDYKTLSKTKKYRQRVTVYKEDELGNAVQGAEFTLAVKNVMELDDIKIGNGQESEEITDITGTSTFEMSGQTGQNGLIWWKITYSMESLEYGYVPAEILQDKLKIVKVDAKNKSKKLPNAEFELKGSKGGKVVKVKTDENGEAMIEGVLIAGETYTIKETKAPSGYELAADITYKIKDTGDIQIITVKDKAKTTKTGVIMKSFSYGFVIITILVSMALVLFGGRKKRVRRSY